MVYQEVWSNAAVGQQEREGWVGAEQKGEDSRADTLPPNTCTWSLDSHSNRLKLPLKEPFKGPTSRSHHGDGCCHPGLNFFAKSGTSVWGISCVSFPFFLFLLFMFHGRKPPVNSDWLIRQRLFFLLLSPGEFANLSDCFIPAQAALLLLREIFPIQLRGTKRGECSGNIPQVFFFWISRAFSGHRESRKSKVGRSNSPCGLTFNSCLVTL